jgi:sugar phosphate permease
LGIVLLVFGFGSTNVTFGATVAASSGVANNEQGLAGALVNASRQIGSAVGVAVLLSIVAIDATANSSIAHLADGFRLALACAAGLALVATLLSLRLPRADPHTAPAA